tara:strand:- start:1708 stop:2505 length:798 start_codon:yes stop_codon:yes gene_type:complete
MKILKSAIILLFITLTFTNCSTDDDSNEFWDAITVADEFKAATFVFSSTEIGTCDEHGEHNLNAVLNSEISNITGSSVNGLVLFPSITDPLYNHISEELKFLYDQNGDQTFNSFPSFVDDMNCFDIDSLAWYNSIETTINRVPLISLGKKNSLKGDQQTIYIRGIYNDNVSSSHSIALYLFKKSLGANQKIISGQTIYKTHKNVIYSGATNTYGKVLSAKNKSEEFHEKFQFDLNNVPSAHIGYAVIIYELKDGKPVGIINSLIL